MATTYLQRTVSSTGNRKVATFSAWIKRTGLGEAWFLNAGGNNSSGYNLKIGFGGSDEIFILHQSGSTNLRYQTTRQLRDTSAFYHIVVALDTTNSTSTDRVKIYINGTRETAIYNVTVPSLNLDLEMNQSTSSKNLMAIGTRYNTGDLFDGIMSHVHWCDGTALAPTVFGSVDSTTGEWKINTAPSFTPGTNGFTILKDGNTITDQSANSNNFSLGGGTLTNTNDCPDNVFATVNPLWFNSSTFTNGNLTVAGGSAHRPNIPTLAASSGKYYFEAKMISGNTNKWWLGYADQEYLDTRQYLTSNIDLGGGNISGGVNQKNGAVTAGWGNGLQQSPVSTISNFFSSAGAANDIMAMAIDLDNQKIWWSLNGTWRNGSASASTTFNASYPDSTNLDAGRNYYLCCGSENSKWSVNYGNGFFGTTAITTNSGNGYAGAEGASKFNYAVPSGFSAISTKGLNN